MSEEHPSLFLTALILDTSFFRTIGGTENEAYQTFIQYVKSEDVQLYLTPGVEEAIENYEDYGRDYRGNA